MITDNDIQHYIAKLPPAPKILQKTLSLVDEGDLVGAAKVAEEDMALKTYLKTLVNRPIYGFKDNITNISQIFGILGINIAKQSLYNYSLSLLTPKEWHLFALNQTLFYDLQAQLSGHWNKILQHLHNEDKDIEISITLLPSSIIICEALFKDHIKEIKLLRSAKELDYNTILKRLTSLDLFDISCKITNMWDMPTKIDMILKAASGTQPSTDKEVNTLAKWMHLLLFYELSQSRFIEVGLNDFIEFNVEYVADIYDEFIALVGAQ
jgi:HD-like signal output (HDOD) protein